MSNFLLSMMLLSYSIPIIYVYRNYSYKNESVSSIITSDECQRLILVGMIIMGIFTVLYELNRNIVNICAKRYSIISIFGVLIGIYGVILIKEEKVIHYIFASLVFLSIIGFMFTHCWYNFCNNFLNFSFYIQIVFTGILVFIMCKMCSICNNILFCEVFLILNFAIYYLYLHNLYYKI